jgi:curli biogenesis system outer membrane secretion channel CsgG
MGNSPAVTLAAAGFALAAILISPSYAQGAGTVPHGGPKKSVSVVGFEAPELVQGGATPEELAALLVNALLKDGRFVVVERMAMADVQTEQALGQGGAVTAETAAQAGHFLGASAIVKGTVTKFEPAAGGGSLGVGGIPFLGGGGLGLNSTTSVVEISLRVIDTTTSQIIYTGTAKGSASARTVQLQGTTHGYDWNGGGFMKTPLGEALQDAIQKSVDKIAAGMAKVPWSALVIESSGTTVYITAGADQGIEPGMTMHVYHKNRELTDPSTGAVLDVMMDAVGTIQVETVRDKISIATITEGNPPARGDVVKLN